MFRFILIGALAVLPVLIYFVLRKSWGPAYSSDETSLIRGKMLFATHCLSCHGMQEDGIGPRLGGVTSILSEDQLKTFIRDPGKVISSGEQRALALHARYKQTMPAFAWMEDDTIHAILSYIHHQTERYNIQAPEVIQPVEQPPGLSGRLVEPVRDSNLKIELEEVVTLPRLTYSTPDLGIATLRPHPSGDGRLFISDQGGIIYEIEDGKASIFLDLRSYIKDFSIGPGLATGLGSFDFHPDYLNNGLIYLTHAEKYNGQAPDYRVSDSVMAEVQWILGEWKMDDVARKQFQGSRRELLRLHAPTFGHGAQDLAFKPALSKQHPEYGFMYWGFGDGGSNNIRKPELGHHRSSFLGTIMRIDPAGENSTNKKYGIPADNPFADDPDPSTVREIYAYGFRNPHRITWDVANNYRMIVTDIGESNIEEINIVEKGGDYGWPGREGDFGIATKKDLKTVYRLQPGDEESYRKPFAQYDHLDGYAISGGFVYDGPIERLRNKYVFGDIVNGRLFYVNIDEALMDSTVYELSIVKNGVKTDLREMSGIKRLHLRLGFDRFAKQLYIFTKADGKVYLVK